MIALKKLWRKFGMDNKDKARLQKEILGLTDKYPHGRWLLSPRIGKTKLVIDLIKRDKPISILWVTPYTNLMGDIEAEFITWKAKKYLKTLTISTYANLKNISGRYELVVLDEDQFLTEENSIPLISRSIVRRNIISMTGTPSTDFKKNVLYTKLGLSTLYKLPIGDAVNIGLLSDYKIRVVQIKMSRVKNIQTGNKLNRFKTSESAQMHYLTKQVETMKLERNKRLQQMILTRMHAVKNSPAKKEALTLMHKELLGRKIIFAPNIAIADELSKNTYHSKTKGDKFIAFKNGEINDLVMVNSGGIGATFEKLRYLVVGQADSDHNGNTSQKITRTLLSQGNYQARIYLLCLMNSPDVDWVESTLKRFDKNKITYITYENLCKELLTKK